MLTVPMDILTLFPVRKTGKQKKAFRAAVQAYAEGLGYACREEKGSFGSRNVVIGNPDTADFLVTAHYDTCAILPIPNLITPCNFFLYFLYQMLIVAVCFLLAIIIGVGIGLLAGNGLIAGLFTYGAIWAILICMIVGPANRHNANDNTSGVVAVLEIARTLPEIHRKKVCFVLFDLEEAGLLGSASYRKAHKEQLERQLVLNLDCVGDGDHLMLFPTKKLRKDRDNLASLYPVCGHFGRKSLLLREKGFAFYPSDQMNFPYGVGICALHKGKLGLYLSRIHTPKDTILEETNVNILRAALTSLICCGAVTNGKEE